MSVGVSVGVIVVDFIRSSKGGPLGSFRARSDLKKHIYFNFSPFLFESFWNSNRTKSQS